MPAARTASGEGNARVMPYCFAKETTWLEECMSPIPYLPSDSLASLAMPGLFADMKANKRALPPLQTASAMECSRAPLPTRRKFSI